eukprot:2170038-Rhodomonas_salina.1
MWEHGVSQCSWLREDKEQQFCHWKDPTRRKQALQRFLVHKRHSILLACQWTMSAEEYSPDLSR